MSTNTKVNGVTWNPAEVAKSANADAFVALHMADAGTYKRMKPEDKEKALRLTYGLCVPEPPKPEKPPKVQKPAVETPVI